MKTDGKTIADRIRCLRRSRGLSQAALAKRMGMTPSQLCKIELGHNDLSGSSLRRVAEALDLTISELMGESSPERELRRERSSCVHEAPDMVRVLVDDLPEAMVTNVIQVACGYEEKFVAAKEMLGVMSQSSVQLLYPYGVDEESAELLARDMRAALGVGCAPVVGLEAVLEMRGVRVVRHTFAKQFQSGSFFNLRNRALLIVLNASNTQERNDYRLAYELGAAAVFAMSGFGTIRDEGTVHRLLRRFTAAFLMPEEAVRMDVARSGIAPDRWTFDLLVMMKSHFAVSAEAYALRLESLGLIVPELRTRLRDQLRAYYRRHPKAMEPQPRDSSMLAILAAFGKGKKR